ncbi:Ig-like domain-containing protein [Pseudomonas sp. CGJS7]|uniref:Ig-like domain-containing protein n=1 Tax=Pseudomonas sp. CGJS7 TaxID=3109348 RepID=UPI003008BF1E
MRPLPQGLAKRWAWCGAALALCLTTSAIVLGTGDANAALEPLPPQLARALALNPREARAQLPDGRWLVLERDGSALKLIEDRDNGAVLRRWPLSSPRRLASVSLLPSGRVLIWGGVDGNNRPQSTGLWFDPDSRTLTPTAGLNLSPRAGHAATVLSDGRLLITGGWMPGAVGVAKAELWDERGSAATLASGRLAPARLGHRSRLEADGRVRLFEGVDGQGRKLAQDQLYDPAQESFAAAAAMQNAATAQAPRLVASTPRNQSRGVATDARLSLRFSEPLRASELNRANITLLGPGGFAAVRVTPAEAGRLLFVAPQQRLQANAAYSLLIDGVHARNGQALATTLIDFETAGARADAISDTTRAPTRTAANATVRPAASIAAAPAAKSASVPAPSAATMATSVAITPDGAPGTVETLTPDIPGEVSFNLGTGNFGLGIGPLQTPGSTAPATLTIRRFGTVVASIPCPVAFGGCAFNLGQSGSYTAQLLPPAGATLKFTATLSRDRTATMSVTSSPVSISLTRRGQNARVTFNATASTTANMGIRTTGQRTTPAGRDMAYTLYAPNGSLVTGRFTSASDALIGPFFPVTGTYTLLLEPIYGETATVSVSTGPSNQLLVDGEPRIRERVAIGSLLTMDLEANAQLSLGVSGLSNGSGPVTLSLRAGAGGPSLVSDQCVPYNGGCRLNISGLPAGMYIAQFGTPSSGSGTLSYTAHLSSQKRIELTTAGSKALDLRPGQNGFVDFDFDPNQSSNLSISGVTTAPAQRPIVYTLYSPNGSPQQTTTVPGPTQMSLLGLPAGRYSLRVDPKYGETVSARFELNNHIVTAQVGGPTAEMSTRLPGESMTFFLDTSGSANAWGLGLGLTEMSIAGTTQPPTVTVKRADGSIVHSKTCPAAPQQESCDLNLPTLAQDLYRVEVVPPAGAGPMQFRATASEDLGAPLRRGDTPFALQLTRRGQNAALYFEARAGDNLNLSVRDQLTQPAGATVAYSVRKPDGTVLTSNSVGANGTGGLSFRNLPDSGYYSVFVDPEQAALATANIAIPYDTSAPLVADGEPRTLRNQIPGQAMYLNFRVEQGANLGLGLDQLEGVSAGNGALAVTVRKTVNAVLASTTCEGRMGGCAINLPNLDAGYYWAEIIPLSTQTAYGLRATLSSDQLHTLALAQPLQAVIDRWGQNARYRFQASQGQDLTLAITDHSHASLPPGPLPEHSFSYTVQGPDGRLVSRGESNAGAFLRFGPLEQTGEYSLLIDPVQGDTMSAQVQLNLNENLGHLNVDGDPLRMATQFAGQPLMFTFDVDAQPRMYLSIVAVEPRQVPGYELRIEREGMPSIEVECGADRLGCVLPLNGLAPGRYYAALANVAPNGPPHFAVDAILSTPSTGALVPGQPQPLQLRSGQPGELSFSGASGQGLTLAVSGQATVPAGAAVQYVVRTPGGAVLDSRTSTAAAFNADLPALPADGEYTLHVSAGNGASVQAQLRLDPTP